MATATRKTKTRRATGRKKTRGSGKRTLLENRAGSFFSRRSGKGRFREMDERGRSLSRDRRKKAKATAKRGRGDRGDRRA
jgi:hypothetical protein